MKLTEFYKEELGGTFTHDGDEYLLNPILRITDKFPIEHVPVSELEWIIDTVEDFEYADTNVPILVTPWEGKLVVIDGYHRLLKAVSTGLNALPAKMVPGAILDKYKLDRWKL